MRNAVKLAAASGAEIRGVHFTIAQPTLIEVLATLKPDFFYLDGEHGAFTPHDVAACCRAAELCGVTAIARVPDRVAATITNFLDRGVQGVVAPHVDSLDDAREVVEAAYFAPLGQRSFGAGRPHYGLNLTDRPKHLAGCNAEVSVCIMVESVGALEAAGEIAALDGVDYMSFGMNDLAQALGRPGQPDHPEVIKARDAAAKRIRAAGKPVREDFMRFAWINEIVLTGATKLIGAASAETAPAAKKKTARRSK